MSSFYADENEISPNLDVETNLESCSKCISSSSSLSTALFLSPDRTPSSKSMPAFVIGDQNLDDERDCSRNQNTPPITRSIDFDESSTPGLVSETTGEKSRRENEESEQLAWEMMREESMAAYRMQMDFINSTSNEMSAEDLEAIQMAMRGGDFINNDEEGAPDRDDDQGGEVDDEEEDENQDSDLDQWDYDRLLALGEVIGDVKTERWRLKSKAVIMKLEQLTFTEMQCRQQRSLDCSGACAAPAAASSSSSIPVEKISPELKRVRFDPSCAVCMEVFCGEDSLNVLPCQHYFHVACTEGWLADHNNCPMCKSLVSFTP